MNNLQIVMSNVKNCFILILALSTMFFYQEARFSGGGAPPPIPAPWPHPQPRPIPVPPQPTPQGIVGTMHVNLVIDENEMTVNFGMLRGSPTIVENLKKMDVIWRSFGSNDERLVLAKLTQAAQTTGYPCIIIQDHDGNVIHPKANKTAMGFKAPDNESDLIELIKSVREGTR